MARQTRLRARGLAGGSRAASGPNGGVDSLSGEDGKLYAVPFYGAQSGMKGICLRGLPGWGEMFAPLTTLGPHVIRA